MPFDTEQGSVHVYDRKNFLTRRDTNTVVVELHDDEVFALIEDLARCAQSGGASYLVIESDDIYAKDME